MEYYNILPPECIRPFGNYAQELQHDKTQNWPACVKTVTYAFLVELETD